MSDLPWKPIIQKKRQWKHNCLKDCDPRIKDVWNVGFLDYNEGLYHKKILRQCSKREAIEEGLYQLQQSSYIQDLLYKKGKSFNDIYIGIENWYQFKDDENNKLVSLNPKYSNNVSTNNLMPSTSHPDDLPENMFLCGYYVQSTMGGTSMEASCETGLTAGNDILKKYGYVSSELPIQHTNEYISWLSIPFVAIDKFLYKNNIKPLTYFINPFILLFLLFFIIVFVLVKITHKLKKSIQ